MEGDILDKIILNNMKFYAYHGVLPFENTTGQYFYIDAELFVDISKAGLSDELEDTVDYSVVYGIIKDITENNKFRLIEKLADSISREILSRYINISEIVVRVRKPDAPIEGEFDWVGVEIKRTQNG
jgi:7,8-dihydroneopterin aldolase/epimerase/oxygenase